MKFTNKQLEQLGHFEKRPKVVFENINTDTPRCPKTADFCRV
ncbi:MAG: hypothetical protein PWQ06_179 [Anaerophaga sp.]|nr:hypothetical protein [Anaerophaga sp.]